MQKIISTINIKEAINLLEIEQEEKSELLKEQYLLTFESLKPANLLKSTLKDISSSPILMSDILGTAIGLATGYLSKKIVVGGSDNIFRKLFGTIMQVSVSNTVARHPEAIKSIGKFIIGYIISLKESKSNEE